jgi:hypothetical protein
MVDKDAKPLARVPEVDEWSQRQLVTTTCAFCGESVEALVPQAAAWFAEHRRIKHPDVPEPKRLNRDRSKTHFVGRAASPLR